MGQLHDQGDIRKNNKTNPGKCEPKNQMMRKKKSIIKAQARRAQEFRNLRHANPPTPSNPMHQNRRIPYTNAYQRISTNAETRHNAGLQYGQHKCECPVKLDIGIVRPGFKRVTCWRRRRCDGSGGHPRQSDHRDQRTRRRRGRWLRQSRRRHRSRHWRREHRGPHR